MDKKIIALVPMKGTSERLHNKNMRILCGKPMCYYVLKNLLQSEYIKNIYVDTDSNEIKDYLQQEFKTIKIINRPPNLLGQMVSMERIIEYDMYQTDGIHFFQTFATSPLLSVATINDAIQKYFGQLDQYDSLFSVTKLQKRLYASNGECINISPNVTRNQDLDPYFIQNASFFIFSRKSFGILNKRISRNPFMYELYDEETIDVDYEFDFRLAGLLMNNIKENE